MCAGQNRTAENPIKNDRLEEFSVQIIFFWDFQQYGSALHVYIITQLFYLSADFQK